jgi:cytoskeleton protein RodZ
LPSFGEKLRREREKRNITLDQISESTKIGTRMLQALEEDRFNQLPGGIFNKGFVRAYAHYVGLDEDQIVADYLAASGDVPPVQPELPSHESVRIVEVGSDFTRRQLPWGVFAAILLLAALVLSIWSQREKKHESTAAPAPPAIQRAEDHTAPAPTAPGPAISSTSDRNPSPTKSAVNPATQVPSASPRNPATVVPKTPAETTSLPVPGEFVVLIQAREDSWTTITADGRTVYSGNLSAGDQRAIRGRKEVIVKAGNAGGIDLHFNGTKLNSLGESGQVRTITFGPGGVIPNRPAAPAPQ